MTERFGAAPAHCIEGELQVPVETTEAGLDGQKGALRLMPELMVAKQHQVLDTKKQQMDVEDRLRNQLQDLCDMMPAALQMQSAVLMSAACRLLETPRRGNQGVGRMGSMSSVRSEPASSW